MDDVGTPAHLEGRLHRQVLLTLAMGKIVEVRIPIYPECWETYGSCAQGDVTVEEVLVKPGDTVQFDDNVIILETGKIALDIQSPHAGRVVEVFVAAGQDVAEGALILTIEMD
ncbi:MAG: biotin/lipoyl-containing protein [Sulfuritalea sp.]|nr:biotin/lipoyl-containing protein [Sulfuritalea sp.]MDP1985594.1 biotin/lipoyl-containing protein [Sulfuritalea sp.]